MSIPSNMTASSHDNKQGMLLTWRRQAGILPEYTLRDRFSFAAWATVLVRRCSKRTTDQRHRRTIRSGRLVMDSQPSSRPGGTETRPIREDQGPAPYLYTIRAGSAEVKRGRRDARGARGDAEQRRMESGIHGINPCSVESMTTPDPSALRKRWR